MRTLAILAALAAVVAAAPAFCADTPVPTAQPTAAPALVSTITGTAAKIDGMKVTLTVKPATAVKAEEKVVDITGAKVDGKLIVGAKVEVTEAAGKVTAVKVLEAPKPAEKK